jgi:aspartate racemase
MAANTPHIVFDPVQSQSPIPLLSIVDAARDQAQRLGLRKVGLLGTGFTMKGSFYPEVFSRAGIELRVPTPEEQDYIHDKYMNELLKNLFLPQTGERVMAIIEAMKARDAIEGVILAGTELPLILRQFEARAGIPFLDTTRIHVERAVREMLT